MTQLLQRAFDEASKLPKDEQDVLATWLLDELAVEDAFDQAIAQSASKLSPMAKEALAEDEAGLTEDLQPDRL
jgi:hypothetical protein